MVGHPNWLVKIVHEDGRLVNDANPIPVAAEVILDATDIQIGAVELKDAATSNRASIDASGRISVDGSSVTQPVSAASLPLPSGAATSANQATAISSLGTIITNTAGLASAAAQTTGNTSLNSIDGKLSGAATVAAQGTAGGKTITYVPVAQAVAGTTQLAAASASNKHKVLGAVLTLGTAGTLKFTDSDGDLTGALDIATNGGFVLPSGLVPYFQTNAVNKAISIVSTLGAARGVVALLTEP